MQGAALFETVVKSGSQVGKKIVSGSRMFYCFATFYKSASRTLVCIKSPFISTRKSQQGKLGLPVWRIGRTWSLVLLDAMLK
jgi:hypothetical protein